MYMHFYMYFMNGSPHLSLLEKQKRTRQLDWKPSYCKAKTETDTESQDHEMRERRLKRVTSISLHLSLHSVHFILSFNTHQSSDGFALCLHNMSGKCSSLPPIYRTPTYISHLSNPQWFIIVSVLSSRQNTNYHLITIITKWERLTGSNQIEKRFR